MGNGQVNGVVATEEFIWLSARIIIRHINKGLIRYLCRIDRWYDVLLNRAFYREFMQRTFRVIVSTFFLLFSLLLSPFSHANERERVLVFAASSMTTALDQIAQAYQKQTERTVILSYASSSALARQLAYGAPADIYVSANEKWMNYAVDQAVINANTLSPWVSNALVVVSARDDISQVNLDEASFLHAIGNARMAIADPTHVPAGIYAKESLENLQLWSVLANKLAYSNSVRAALALVERKEAPIGIVYRSDAIASKAVHVVADVPDTSHAPIIFPKAMTKDASEAAAQFFDFLSSDDAHRILAEQGFNLVSSSLSDQELTK
ncbi:molybdate ABC transporter substrate-binding protein [Enterovibrio norvegicus]|uniref:molybdate ABC transporter substrate-binding protein n=1 Tax=Enterovibrio norvegicus TaxID=188144 RepID=UPI003D0D488F